MNKKILSPLLSISTLALGFTAIYISYQTYNLQTTTPTSPKAASITSCELLAFTVNAKTTYSCDTPCTSDDQCQTANSNYVCYIGSNTCRHSSYLEENTCEPPAATQQPTPTSSPTPLPPTNSPSPTPTLIAQATTPTPTNITYPETLPDTGNPILTILLSLLTFTFIGISFYFYHLHEESQ